MRAALPFAVAAVLLLPAAGPAEALPCRLPVPLFPGCEVPEVEGTLLRFVPILDGKAAAALLVEATEPESRLSIIIEVQGWDAPFQAVVWRPPPGGADGLTGFGTGAEVEVRTFKHGPLGVRKEVLTPGASWMQVGYVLPQGTHAFYVGAAAEGALEGGFRLLDEGGTHLLRELGGSTDLRRLREFSPAVHAAAEVQPAAGTGAGGTAFASTSVDVRTELFAIFDTLNFGPHAGWWGLEEPDGDVRNQLCTPGCGLYVERGEAGRWRFFAHFDAGAGVWLPEPMLFLADLPHP